MAKQEPREDSVSRAAVWIIDMLAAELSGDSRLDRPALIAALQRMAGYEQADSLFVKEHEALRSELVARLAGRLARG